MKSDLDKFAEDLQAQILEEARREYSEMIIDHWMRPRNFKRIEHPNGYAKITGPCGDTVEIFLIVTDKVIKDISYLTDGCGTTIACGSITTEMAKGKSIESAKKIDQQSILKACGGLPESDEHCALLTANTLQKAIQDYESKKVSF